MAKTRGGLSASPSSPTPRPHRATMGGAASPPVQAPTIPPSEGEPLLSAGTPPGGHPRTLCHQPIKPRAAFSATKRTKFSDSHSVNIPPETVIRRPMIKPHRAAPPELPQDEQMPQAQQDEILTETTPPAPAAHTSVHMPEAIHPTSPITSDAPPVMPATPAPPPSSEPTVTVSLAEFRGLVHSLQTLSTTQDSLIQQMATIRAHQDQIIATQTPFGHDRSAPSEPLVPDEESLPAEQPIPEEEIRAEPSHDPHHI
ncbi:hypothetical protein AAG906_027273 [Vitis piasezkii]